MSEAKKRLYVLDTNVLMHDPTALFRFEEHDIYLPMSVIEELDKAKKGLTEVARNTRQVSRYLEKLIHGKTQTDIQEGLPLVVVSEENHKKHRPTGKLFLEPIAEKEKHHSNYDTAILNVAHRLTRNLLEVDVVFVSKDINLRIKATLLGVQAEDYSNDQVLEDIDLLYSGAYELPENFWETQDKQMTSWQEKNHTYYRVITPLAKNWTPNHCLYHQSSNFEAIVREIDGDTVTLIVATDYRSSKHSVWGITARNREQNFALNFLLNPEIELVTLCGVAGTGKTLLTLAAGLLQVLENHVYSEIIMTRSTIPLGEDIGFLPGTEEEKMTPWMGALMDNLEVLTLTDTQDNWSQQVTQDLLRNRIKIRSMNFMRGRTFLNKYIILDEAQNLSAKQLKTLLTRAGPGTKMVCLGNLSQIDTPYLTETTSGLTNVVDTFKYWPYGGHITLMRGERSRLADFTSEHM